MKKFLKKFFVGLTLFIVIVIIIPVALVFVVFFDTGKMKVDYDENFTQETWSRALVVDSLDNTAETKMAQFSVTENDLNNFIYSGIKDNKDIQKYLTQLAFDITDDSYIISASGKLSFFETRAKLTAKLEKKSVYDSEGKSKEAFVFTIQSFSLGKLTKLKEVITFFLTKFLNNDTLDALSESLNIHVDLKNSCLFIYSDDLRQILKDGMKVEGGNTEFYFNFINDFLDHHLVDFDFYGNNSLNVRIKLEDLTGNDYAQGEYVCYNVPYENTSTTLTINGEKKKLTLGVIRDAVTYLVNNGVIPFERAFDTSDYLFHGYSYHNDPKCDLSSIGITNKEAYVGFKDIMTNISIDEELENGIAEFTGYNPDINEFDLVTISESTLNNYLKAQSVLGNKYFLERETTPGQHKINFIALDNTYINLTTNNAIISVGLNINGLETIITLQMKMNKNNPDSSKLIYDVESVYYGAKEKNLFASHDTEELIFSTLSSSLNDESFRFDENGQMTISFDAIIDSAINGIRGGDAAYIAAYKDFLKNNADKKIEIEGDDIAANSKIKIKAIRK